jgi:hypothetical protein
LQDGHRRMTGKKFEPETTSNIWKEVFLKQ